jgi:2,3-bisphosphoglycerate-independent phosphoglycerate mutase
MKTKKSVILIIRDGWGYNPKKNNNAVKSANTPNENYYLKNFPNGLLSASGEAVGLDKGYQGNSEVGHLTIGSGRIIYQSLPRINQSIKDGSFFRNQAFLKTINHCRKNNSTLHLIGLLQAQGVHSHIDHLFALLKLCKKKNFKRVFIHIITDGRDAPVNESLKHLKKLNREIKKLGLGEIVSVSGRYYAMDRDKRWARTKFAYKSVIEGEGNKIKDVENYIKEKHLLRETDEFISPASLISYQGVNNKDGIIFFNYRTDRTRQLTQAIIDKRFTGFKRNIKKVAFTAMTEYYKPFPANSAFKDIQSNKLLGEIVSQKGLRQLRISETEKYAHVTFFFNGQNEKANPKEDRIMVSSPKVATYDLKPEMSVFSIAKNLVKEIKKEQYDLIIVNLVNGDMVGHTGDTKAIIKAIESVDQAQGEIINQALKHHYTCLLIADHGNAEDQSSLVRTSHTTNPVPVILVSGDEDITRAKILKNHGLKDVAPSILQLLGIKKPKEMTGNSFIKY